MKTEEYLKKPYARILIPEVEGGFSAEILEFPGCFAEGETADEALRKLERSAISWIEAAQSQGQEIPPPSMNQGYGGKIALRLPKGIHRRASELAQRENTSLNQFILSAVAAKIGAEDFCSALLKRIEHRVISAAITVVASTDFSKKSSPVSLSILNKTAKTSADDLRSLQ
jgi:predicted RNase H-like HicB family nuclease